MSQAPETPFETLHRAATALLIAVSEYQENYRRDGCRIKDCRICNASARAEGKLNAAITNIGALL